MDAVYKSCAQRREALEQSWDLSQVAWPLCPDLGDQGAGDLGFLLGCPPPFIHFPLLENG